MAYVPPEEGKPYPRPGWQQDWKDPYNYDWPPENNERESFIPKNTTLYWILNGSEEDDSCLPRTLRGLGVGAAVGAYTARMKIVTNVPKHYTSKVVPQVGATFYKYMGFGSMIGVSYFASKCFAEGVLETNDWKTDVIAVGCTCGTLAAVMGRIKPAAILLSSSWALMGYYQICSILGVLHTNSSSSRHPQRVWNYKMGNPQSPVLNRSDYDPLDKIKHSRTPPQETVEHSE